MRMKWASLTGALLLLLASAMSAGADERADYNRRAAARDLSLFHSLDRNADGAVTRLEAQGDLTFMPRFDDMDINRDGIVTLEELQRFVQLTFGIALARTDASVAPSTAHGKPGAPMK